MNLKDIAHISGKSGLHRILKPTRTGMIVESLDEKKTKQVVGMQTRVSVLKEISIYTSTSEGSQPLEKVMDKVYEKYGEELPVEPDSSSEALSEFLASVLPDFDRSRVYVSDIKRLVSWYSLLIIHAPQMFKETANQEETVLRDSVEEGEIQKGREE
jgi:hypothetical protein